MLTEKFLREELKTKSTASLAKELGTYPNKIRRAAKKFGIPLLDHSDAQKLALKEGRIKHPTEGKEREKRVKEKISVGVYETYAGMSEDKREEISETHKKIWAKIPKRKKDAMQDAAFKAIRKTAKDGSKTENFLKNELPKHGHVIEFHKKGLVNTKLEVDIYLPDLNTIIEINGISHYKPIYGEDILKKKKKSDSDKYGLILGKGYCVIIIKHLVKTPSVAYHRDLLNKLLTKLGEIAQAFPREGERLIEIHAGTFEE